MRTGKATFRRARCVALLGAVLACMPSAQAQPKFKILHHVGGSLFSGLTSDAKGNLYGVTAVGGLHNTGTIFKLSLNSNGQWVQSLVYDFDHGNADGCSLNGGLIFDTSGNMYGTTVECGTNGFGTIYELMPGSHGWTLKVLYEVGSEEGTGPVVMGKGGNLYGAANGGLHDSGTIFELVHDSGGWHRIVLYNFEGLQTGFDPADPLTFDTEGRLYGATSGTYNQEAGTVFRLGKPNSKWKQTKLWQFDGTDGGGPHGGLIFDNSGNLYGTSGGGSNGCMGYYTCGTAYKLTPTEHGSWKETVIYGFPDASNGFEPIGGLVFDKQGNLYGTTTAGGIVNLSCPVGCGVVYKLTPEIGGKWKYTVLHKFNGNDGSASSGLIIDDKGNLYGTAFTVVYEITP
jgi:uncharacterized repeat protein (TIGR03803 family)